QPEGIAINLASQFNRYIRIDDRSRVYGQDLCLKNVDAFQKERTLLGEEDWETLVGPDYQLVRLDLRKIRIQRKIEGHVRGQAVFSGQSQIEFHRLVNETAGIQHASVDLCRSQRALTLPSL